MVEEHPAGVRREGGRERESWGERGESLVGKGVGGSRVRAKRWQNLTNHPLDALNDEAWLYSMAKLRIVLSSVNSCLLILS